MGGRRLRGGRDEGEGEGEGEDGVDDDEKNVKMIITGLAVRGI